MRKIRGATHQQKKKMCTENWLETHDKMHPSSTVQVKWLDVHLHLSCAVSSLHLNWFWFYMNYTADTPRNSAQNKYIQRRHFALSKYIRWSIHQTERINVFENTTFSSQFSDVVYRKGMASRAALQINFNANNLNYMSPNLLLEMRSMSSSSMMMTASMEHMQDYVPNSYRMENVIG